MYLWMQRQILVSGNDSHGTETFNVILLLISRDLYGKNEIG